MRVGRAIQVLRESKGVKPFDLAKQADISASMLSMIETGQRDPSMSVLRRIAGSICVPLDVLLAVSQPGEGTLVSSDKTVEKLVDALVRLEEAETELRSMMRNQNGAMRQGE